MKINYTFGFILIVLFIISCKNETKEQQTIENVTSIQNSADDGSNPDEIIDNLGVPASNFINKYYHNTTIKEVKNSRDGFITKLSNGVLIEFDINGDVIEVDSPNEPLPNKIIPNLIITNLKENKLDTMIISKFEFKDQIYRITINNISYQYDEHYKQIKND